MRCGGMQWKQYTIICRSTWFVGSASILRLQTPPSSLLFPAFITICISTYKCSNSEQQIISLCSPCSSLSLQSFASANPCDMSSLLRCQFKHRTSPKVPSPTTDWLTDWLTICSHVEYYYYTAQIMIMCIPFMISRPSHNLCWGGICEWHEWREQGWIEWRCNE